MEFNGFVVGDFDFFRKKDKAPKDEYEKQRNELKLHFRGFLYSLQKKYHLKTNGVLELQKDFQNFNKRSTNIEATYREEGWKREVAIALTSDALRVELIHTAIGVEGIKEAAEILKKNKSLIWEYLTQSKFMNLNFEVIDRNKKIGNMKLTSHDISGKNYETFIEEIEKFSGNDRYQLRLGLGGVYHKNECVKQAKALENTAFDLLISLMDLNNRI